MRDFLSLIVLVAVVALILGATTDVMPKPITDLARQIWGGAVYVFQSLVQLLGFHNEYFFLMPH